MTLARHVYEDLPLVPVVSAEGRDQENRGSEL